MNTAKTTGSRRILAIFLVLIMSLSMLGISASAAPGAILVAPGDTIATGGVYQIDTTKVQSGVITITTSDPVTLIGKGFALGEDYVGISVEYTVPNANLTLQNLYISSPYNNGRLIDFVGSGNSLTALSTSILESNGYGNLAILHVGPKTELTIYGDESTNLYLYKRGAAAAIGGDENEASGAITFASGNIYAKGSQTGAVIGGDDPHVGMTNGDITISGGQLSVEANARGAAIGASNQGECAGNVYITGGSTLINVDWVGSAIGRGDSGKTVGNLYISGGSLEVYVDPNAASSWNNVSGPNTSAITANLSYGTAGSTTPADVVAVDVSGLDLSAGLMAEAVIDGAAPVVLYKAVGLNQLDFLASQTYTPDNWTVNPNNTTLYLYVPANLKTGAIQVIGENATANYTINPPAALYTGFPVTRNNLDAVNFVASNATVNVNGQAVTTTSIPDGGLVNFSVVPDSGYAITSVTSNSGTVTDNGGGVYTLGGVATTPVTVTVVTEENAASPHIITFNAPVSTTHEAVYLNGVEVTSAAITDGASLTFSAVPTTGYVVSAVTTSSGTITDNGGGYYTLSGATADATVTVTTVSGDAYNIKFIGYNETVSFNGVAATTAVAVSGTALTFTVTPAVGYSVTSVTSNSGTVTNNQDGTYTLTDAAANATVYIATAAGATYNVTFTAPNAIVYVNGQATSAATIPSGGTLNFSVTPNVGYTVSVLTTSNGTITSNPDGTYTLSGVTANTTVTVTTAATTYNVTFTAPNATVYVNGQAVSTATIPAGGELNFTVLGATGYVVTGLTATNGTVTNLGDGSYTLSNVSANTTVTVATTQGFVVTFEGASATQSNMQVRVNGIATTAATVLAGSNLSFTVIPDLGYTVSSVKVGTQELIPSSGVYTILNITGPLDVVITTAAATTGYWSANADTSWYDPSNPQTSYSLTSAAQLAGLASLVNNGTSFSDVAISLATTGTFDLSAYQWVPIGGGRDFNLLNEPTGNYFAGSFNGNNLTVSGINFTVGVANAGAGAYGLFGYVNGGTLSNVTVAGTITAANDGVGGIVGFTNGNVTAVVNKVAITDPGASGIGGVAGIVENVATSGATTVTVTQSANLANISGRSRLGGVVGAALASTNGSVTITQSFNSGAITVANSGDRSYAGGVVGYSMGAIQDVYNTGSVTASGSTYTFVGGIAGLLYGADAPYGSLSDVYNAGVVTGVSGMSIEPLYAYADNSANVVISNAVYIGPPAQDQLGATWTTGTVNAVTAVRLTSSQVIGGNYLNSTYFISNGRYPVFTTQTITAAGSTTADLDAAIANLTGWVNTIIIPGTINVTGTYTLDIGANAGGVVRNTFVGDTFDVAAGGSLTLVSGTIGGGTGAGSGVGVVGTFTQNGGSIIGNIAVTNGGGVNVNAGGTFAQNGGTIAGNTAPNNGGGVYIASNTVTLSGGSVSSNSAEYGAGVYVAGGNLTLSSDELISYNNASMSGGGVYFSGGTLSFASGSVIGNSALLRGGGIYVGAGTLTAGANTSIASNITAQGGGVYIASGATFNLNGGTISGNTASNGGGVFIAATGAFNLNGGTISGNILAPTTGTGAGIYVTASGTLTITPSDPVDFDLVDVIYLSTTTTYIGVGATLVGITSPLTVQSAAPGPDVVVAQGVNAYEFVDEDVNEFSYATGGYTFELTLDNEIVLVAARI